MSGGVTSALFHVGVQRVGGRLTRFISMRFIARCSDDTGHRRIYL